MKKIFIVFLTILVFCSFSVIAFASDVSPAAVDVYGKSTTISTRYDKTYKCIAPSDSNYRYYAVFEGETGDFNWIGRRYILVFSTAPFLVENDAVSFGGRWYYYAADSLEQIEDFMSSKASSVNVYYSDKSLQLSLNMGNGADFSVVYSNYEYDLNSTHYTVRWPFGSQFYHIFASLGVDGAYSVVLSEVLGLLPIVLSLLIGFISIRKGIGFIRSVVGGA